MAIKREVVGERGEGGGEKCEIEREVRGEGIKKWEWRARGGRGRKEKER